jgi:hypothetical protein
MRWRSPLISRCVFLALLLMGPARWDPFLYNAHISYTPPNMGPNFVFAKLLFMAAKLWRGAAGCRGAISGVRWPVGGALRRVCRPEAHPARR